MTCRLLQWLTAASLAGAMAMAPALAQGSADAQRANADARQGSPQPYALIEAPTLECAPAYCPRVVRVAKQDRN